MVMFKKHNYDTFYKDKKKARSSYVMYCTHKKNAQEVNLARFSLYYFLGDSSLRGKNLSRIIRCFFGNGYIVRVTFVDSTSRDANKTTCFL